MRYNVLKLGILTGMLLGLFVPVSAQKAELRRADLFYKEQVYPKAFKFYRKAYLKDSSDVRILRRLADVSYRIGENGQSLRYAAKLISRNTIAPDDYLRYAKALKVNGNYVASAYWLKRYNALGEGNEQGEELELQLVDMMELFRDSSSYEVTPLAINTDKSEIGPTVVGNKLVFCSSGMQLHNSRKSYLDEEPYLKLYSADILPDGQTGTPKIFAPTLSSRFHDGPICYAPKGNLLYITHNQQGPSTKSRDEFVHLKIQKAKQEAGRWNYASDLPFNSRKYSVAHPAANACGDVVFFVSDRPGGYGGTDLYVSRLVNGEWTKPLNLGPEINSSGNELFPYLAADSTLYFSSNGHGGLGGLDLFKATPEDGKYQMVRNLGAPINSPGDDFGIALLEQGNKGYFSSNRNGGKGQDDIYFFEKKEFRVPVHFVVNDAESGTKIARAKIFVLDQEGDTVASGLSNSAGVLDLDLDGGKEYRVHVFGKNYFQSRQDLLVARDNNGETRSENIQLTFNPGIEGNGTHPLFMDLEDGQPIQVLGVYSIHYDLAKWNLRPDDNEVLNSILDFLAANPDVELRIESHADSRGKREMNDLLSQKRARIVNNFFVSRYINPSRIRYKGFGESRLLNICLDGVKCSEDEHAVNRRSVLKIIRKGPYLHMHVLESAFYF